MNALEMLAPRPLANQPVLGRPVVQIQQASVTYPAPDAPVRALHQAQTWRFRQGEFISLIGPSGCGKTTLLRVIADLEPITSGTVRVNGLSPHDAWLARAYGYVFQAAALLPWRTVLSNVMSPELQGTPPEVAREIARTQLARVAWRSLK